MFLFLHNCSLCLRARVEGPAREWREDGRVGKNLLLVKRENLYPKTFRNKLKGNAESLVINFRDSGLIHIIISFLKKESLRVFLNSYLSIAIIQPDDIFSYKPVVLIKI